MRRTERRIVKNFLVVVMVVTTYPISEEERAYNRREVVDGQEDEELTQAARQGELENILQSSSTHRSSYNQNFGVLLNEVKSGHQLASHHRNQKRQESTPDIDVILELKVGGIEALLNLFLRMDERENFLLV